jgi:hypothetical protein
MPRKGKVTTRTGGGPVIARTGINLITRVMTLIVAATGVMMTGIKKLPGLIMPLHHR